MIVALLFLHLNGNTSNRTHRVMGYPGGASGKEPSCQCRRHDIQVQSLGQEDPLEEGMATHSSFLACKIPWTEEPSGLQFKGSQSQTRLKQISTHTHGVISELIRKMWSVLWILCSVSYVLNNVPLKPCTQILLPSSDLLSTLYLHQNIAYYCPLPFDQMLWILYFSISENLSFNLLFGSQ